MRETRMRGGEGKGWRGRGMGEGGEEGKRKERGGRGGRLKILEQSRDRKLRLEGCLQLLP